MVPVPFNVQVPAWWHAVSGAAVTTWEKATLVFRAYLVRPPLKVTGNSFRVSSCPRFGGMQPPRNSAAPEPEIAQNRPPAEMFGPPKVCTKRNFLIHFTPIQSPFRPTLIVQKASSTCPKHHAPKRKSKVVRGRPPAAL